MDTSTTETVATEIAVEGKESEGESVSIPRKDLDNLNQTIGSLKREVKDLRKPKTETETTQKNQTEDNAFLQKLERISLRQANITHQDDVDLAKNTAKKWGVDLDEVLSDEDFLVKLEKQQTKRSNEVAISNVRGGQGTSQAKNTPEYWIAKGVPPSREEVPDRKTRTAIARAFMAHEGNNGKKFYND